MVRATIELLIMEKIGKGKLPMLNTTHFENPVP